MNAQMHVDYEDRFSTMEVPRSAFPLPLPKRLRPPEKMPSWFDPLILFAERYVSLTPAELSAQGRIPRQFEVASPKNKILGELHADILVGMRFYAQWSLAEDNPKHFPKGVQVLIDNAREEVLQAIEIAKNRDWALLVVNEYADSIDRCRSLCDATRRGHPAQKNTPLSFERKHVLQTMKDTHGFVGLVDYDHVCRVLLREASDEAEQ
jgi:hypothetical protein